MAKPLPAQTTFANQAPPWQLTQLDADIATAYAAINDIGTYANVLQDTGAVNALTASSPAGVTFALVAGVTVTIIAANTTSVAAPTLNINATGAKTILDNNGGPLVAGVLIGGARYTFCYDGTNWRLLSFGTQAITQTLAQGSTVSTTEVYVSVPLPIAANSAYPGSTFRITYYGGLNNSGTNTLTERIRIGATGTVSDAASIVTQSIVVTGVGANFRTIHYVHFRTVGSSGTYFHEEEVYGLSQTSQSVGIDAAGTTVNTTGGLFIGLTQQTSNAAMTCNSVMVLAERLY